MWEQPSSTLIICTSIYRIRRTTILNCSQGCHRKWAFLPFLSLYCRTDFHIGAERMLFDWYLADRFSFLPVFKQRVFLYLLNVRKLSSSFAFPGPTVCVYPQEVCPPNTPRTSDEHTYYPQTVAFCKTLHGSAVKI